VATRSARSTLAPATRRAPRGSSSLLVLPARPRGIGRSRRPRCLRRGPRRSARSVPPRQRDGPQKRGRSRRPPHRRRSRRPARAPAMADVPAGLGSHRHQAGRADAPPSRRHPRPALGQDFAPLAVADGAEARSSSPATASPRLPSATTTTPPDVRGKDRPVAPATPTTDPASPFRARGPSLLRAHHGINAREHGARDTVTHPAAAGEAAATGWHQPTWSILAAP
jgi:hypothetical protein